MKPWEKYQGTVQGAIASNGPWTKYGGQNVNTVGNADNSGNMRNLVMGALSGATNIGKTFLWPFDKLGLTGLSPQERSAIINQFFAQNAQPSSLPFKAGELGSEIAGTAGTGGMLAKGAEAIPAAVKFATALRTGGFDLGEASTNSRLVNALTRAGAGAVQGGTQAALVNPSHGKAGAEIGAVLPGIGAIAPYLQTGGRRLMQSALKPGISDLKSGKADVAINTLLENGLNATKGGVGKIKSKLSDINDKIDSIVADSNKNVSKQDVINALQPTREQFSMQVTPQGDIAAIDAAATQFNANPAIKGENIPVQVAQALKRGTYKTLKKKYGQLGSADIEAQKALARGLKEGVANAEPKVAGLNAEESKLIDTLNVTERRALMEANKNPMGLALLAHSPEAWAAFMADKSALFKSLVARMLNRSGQLIQKGTYGIPSVVSANMGGQ